MTYPANIAAGDLVLAIVAFPIIGPGPLVFPAGWALIDSADSGASVSVFVYARTADGSEGADFTFTAFSASTMIGVVYGVEAMTWQGTPEADLVISSTGSSGGAPPQITPSWGATPSLVTNTLSVRQSTGPYTVTTYPTSLPDNRSMGSNTGTGFGASAGAMMAIATAESSAAAQPAGGGIWLFSVTGAFTFTTISVQGGDVETVPDVLLETEADATIEILAANLIVGAVTSAYDAIVPIGRVVSQNPVGGTLVAGGSAVDIVLSLGADSVVVPNLIGQLIAQAVSTLAAEDLQLGAVTYQVSDTVPVGQIFGQSPVAGTIVSRYSLVGVTVSLGRPYVVPDVITDTPAEATEKIENAGLTVGKITVTTVPGGKLGTVVQQFPPPGTLARAGDPVAIVVTALILPFDVRQTVISQYSNSPTILRLVDDMAQYVDPRVNITNFYNLVWNVDTAQGFGLDVWGRIVGVGRLLQLPSNDPVFGFTNEDDPPDWEPFNEGVFYPGAGSTTAYLLPDPAYRTLILTKALSNIVATNAPSLNQLLRNLFPGRGKAYVIDLGGMAMRFVFEFSLTPTEYAILTQSGALPHPAGVSYSVVVIGGDAETFGFAEAGASAFPFDSGAFYLPA